MITFAVRLCWTHWQNQFILRVDKRAFQQQAVCHCFSCATRSQQQKSAVQGVQRGAQGAAQSGGGTAAEEKLVDAALVVQSADLARDCVHARRLRVRPNLCLHQAL